MTPGELKPGNSKLSAGAFQDLLRVLKALSNEARLQVVLALASGDQGFQSLLRETGLQKTALANHLAQLLDAGLVTKPDHGKYALTPDGALFIRALIKVYDESHIRARNHLEERARGNLSEEFLSDFFKRK